MTDTIGDILKNTRLEKGISLEEVSIHTYVRAHYLEALENNNFNALPSRVQGRGFLRLYAGYLDLPVQPLLDFWDGKTTEVFPEEPSLPAPDNQTGQPAVEGTPSDHESLFSAVTSGNQLSTEEYPRPDQQIYPPQTAQQILVQIGKTLRQHRENLGLDFSDVEQYTHIKPRYLQALEKGEIETLPSTVQGRGMLGNYAGFLGMDTDDILMKFADALQRKHDAAHPEIAARKSRTTAPQASPQEQPKWRRFLTADLVIGVSIITILFVFGIWSIAQITAERSKELEATAPSIAEVLLETLTPTMESGLPITETQITRPAAIPETADDNILPEEGEITDEEIDAATPEVDPNAVLQLYVIANQRTFLRIRTDNDIAFEGRVSPGSAYTFSADDIIELETGNAAALQVFYNNNDLGPLGVVGQVVQLVFSTSGIRTPTPIFSPTPTVTPTPTETPQPTPTLPQPTVTPFIP
jgi:cytoskeletal protein RodZ